MIKPVCEKCGNDGSKSGLFLAVDARWCPQTGAWVLLEREDAGGSAWDCLACDHQTPARGSDSGFAYGLTVTPLPGGFMASFDTANTPASRPVADRPRAMEVGDLIAPFAMPEWKPTQGFIQAGRMRGRVYTIRKPSYLVKDELGRVIGAIQEFGDSDEAIRQFGEQKPDSSCGSGFYHLTNYGKGFDAQTPDSRWKDLASYLHYCEGPESPLPAMAREKRLSIVRVDKGRAD